MTTHTAISLHTQKDIALALKVPDDPQQGERIFRNVLHMLRDCLSLDSAICLLRLLPYSLQTIFIEDWHASEQIINLSHPQRFVKALRDSAGKLAYYDFPTEAITESQIQAVFQYVEKEMSTSKKRIFRSMLPFSLIPFFEPLSQATAFTNIYKASNSASHPSKIIQL